MAKDKKQPAKEAAAPSAQDSGMVIDLVQHVGHNRHPQLGEVEVRFEQYVIRLSTPQIREQGKPFVEIGYVGMYAGAPINWLPVGNTFPPDVQQAIEQAIQQKLASMPNAIEADKDLAKAGKTRRVGKAPSDEVMNAAPLESTAAADADTAGSAENL